MVVVVFDKESARGGFVVLVLSLFGRGLGIWGKVVRGEVGGEVGRHRVRSNGCSARVRW